MDNQLTTNCKHKFQNQQRKLIYMIFEQEQICKTLNKNQNRMDLMLDVIAFSQIEVWKQESTV
jgi:hypothetical protein